MKTAAPNDHILFVRGLAAMNVVWYHTIINHHWLILPRLGDISFLLTPSGPISVYIFYLLSGFGVGYSFFSGKYIFRRRSLIQFYFKRVLRFVLAYYACLLVSILFIYKDIPIRAYDIYRFFTFTANIDYLNLPYLQLLAIVSTEMQFYLAAPLLIILLTFLLKECMFCLYSC